MKFLLDGVDVALRSRRGGMVSGGPFATAMLVTYIVLACCGLTYIVSGLCGLFS